LFLGCGIQDFSTTTITTGRGNLTPPPIRRLSHDATENTCSVRWNHGQHNLLDEVGQYQVSLCKSFIFSEEYSITHTL